MSFAGFLFRAFDFFYDPDQNFFKYGSQEGIKDLIYDDSQPTGKLDLYAKKFNKDIKHPVIINFHGGGFVAGEKNHRRGMANYFVNKLQEQNFYFINANYRLCDKPENVFPCFVQDGVKALNWIADHAAEYNFDLDNVYVSGDSAGAHLAAMLVNVVTLPDTLCDKLKCDRPRLKIKGGMLGCGPYDVIAAISFNVLFINAGALFGKSLVGFDVLSKDDLKNYEYLNEISPLNNVNRDYPHMFIIHCRKDEFCQEHGILLTQKLTELGVPYSEFFLKRKLLVNHCFFLSQTKGVSKRCMSKVVEYYKMMVSDSCEGIKVVE